MKIILAKNIKKDINQSIYDSFFEYANELKIDVTFAKDLIELEILLQNSTNYTCIAIFGGDGTMLTYSPICSKYDMPILAINMGKIGFLSQLELNDIKKGLTLLKEGNFYLDIRSMLKVSYKENSVEALNEVILCNKERKGTISLNVWIDTEFVDTYAGDGVILSTPTGSTAYSLSAGGPIVYPDLDITILTPLCPHSLRHCPIVFSGDTTVKIQANHKAECYVDGVFLPWKVEKSEPIFVSKSKRVAKFIKFQHSTFFSKLFKKLSIWNNPESEVNN